MRATFALLFPALLLLAGVSLAPGAHGQTAHRPFPPGHIVLLQNGAIVQFAADGTEVARFGDGVTNHGFKSAVFGPDGYLHVLKVANPPKTVRVYDADFEEVRSHSLSSLTQPVTLALGPRGTYLVGDNVGKRIGEFGWDGTFLRQFANEGELDNPSGILVLPDGQIVVEDDADLQFFDADGVHVREYTDFVGNSGGIAWWPDGRIVCGDSGPPTSTLKFLRPNATLAQSLGIASSSTEALTRGGDGLLYVLAHSGTSDLRRYLPDGTPAGIVAGDLFIPNALAASPFRYKARVTGVLAHPALGPAVKVKEFVQFALLPHAGFAALLPTEGGVLAEAFGSAPLVFVGILGPTDLAAPKHQLSAWSSPRSAPELERAALALSFRSVLDATGRRVPRKVAGRLSWTHGATVLRANLAGGKLLP